MKKDILLVGVLIEETTTLTISETCARYSIPEEVLQDMIEQGFFPGQSTNARQITLDQKALRRMESAFRLHRDLGINLPGVALALDLLDEMESLRRELTILRRHF